MTHYRKHSFKKLFSWKFFLSTFSFVPFLVLLLSDTARSKEKTYSIYSIYECRCDERLKLRDRHLAVPAEVSFLFQLSYLCGSWLLHPPLPDFFISKSLTFLVHNRAAMRWRQRKNPANFRLQHHESYPEYVKGLRGDTQCMSGLFKSPSRHSFINLSNMWIDIEVHGLGNTSPVRNESAMQALQQQLEAQTEAREEVKMLREDDWVAE